MNLDVIDIDPQIKAAYQCMWEFMFMSPEQFIKYFPDRNSRINKIPDENMVEKLIGMPLPTEITEGIVIAYLTFHYRFTKTRFEDATNEQIMDTHRKLQQNINGGKILGILRIMWKSFSTNGSWILKIKNRALFLKLHISRKFNKAKDTPEKKDEYESSKKY